jgi:hypothetical protein
MRRSNRISITWDVFFNKLEKQMSKVIMAVDDSTSIRQMVGFILKDAGSKSLRL